MLSKRFHKNWPIFKMLVSFFTQIIYQTILSVFFKYWALKRCQNFKTRPRNDEIFDTQNFWAQIFGRPYLRKYLSQKMVQLPTKNFDNYLSNGMLNSSVSLLLFYFHRLASSYAGTGKLSRTLAISSTMRVMFIKWYNWIYNKCCKIQILYYKSSRGGCRGRGRSLLPLEGKSSILCILPLWRKVPVVFGGETKTCCPFGPSHPPYSPIEPLWLLPPLAPCLVPPLAPPCLPLKSLTGPPFLLCRHYYYNGAKED